MLTTPAMDEGRQTVPVAVIIPAYNAERYIGETLHSVFSQTVRPLEVIVVNDGSTDRTADIARKMGAIVHDQDNRGPSAARNAGAACASAPWIAYLDGDDLWDPEKLERQWTAITADPEPGIVFTDYWQFDEQSCHEPAVAQVLHHSTGFRLSQVAPGIWRSDRDFIARHKILPSALLIRRDLLLAVGGYDQTLLYGEDVELQLRLLTQTDGLFVDVPLVGHRRHSSSLTANRILARGGDIDIADRVLSSPSRYLPSTVVWYRSERPVLMFRAGRMAAGCGDLPLARRWLLESWRAHKRASTLAWLVFSYLADNTIGRKAMSYGTRAWFAYLKPLSMRVKGETIC